MIYTNGSSVLKEDFVQDAIWHLAEKVAGISSAIWAIWLCWGFLLFLLGCAIVGVKNAIRCLADSIKNQSDKSKKEFIVKNVEVYEVIEYVGQEQVMIKRRPDLAIVNLKEIGTIVKKV